jgi:orotate phosphoribosyltransferase
MESPLETARAARGHYRYESGHHGDLWLDLDALLLDASRMKTWAAELAVKSSSTNTDVVCRPLTGGAFLAQMVATSLGADFVVVERIETATGHTRYRIPPSMRDGLRGRRVLVVDDAVNAGSAWLGTLEELRRCDAQTVAFATLLTSGDAASRIAAEHDAPLVTLETVEREMWDAVDCPLCRSGGAARKSPRERLRRPHHGGHLLSR